MAVRHRDLALCQPVAFPGKPAGALYSRARYRIDSRPTKFLLFIFERSNWRRTRAFVFDAVRDALVFFEGRRSRGFHCVRDGFDSFDRPRIETSEGFVSI